jgi:hypothetical protein
LFLTVKNALTDADSAAVIRKEVTSHDDAEAGESHFEILTTDNATAGTRFYDVQLVTSAGDVFTLFGGIWKVVGDVTTRATRAVLISGAGSEEANGVFALSGTNEGKGIWGDLSGVYVWWEDGQWKVQSTGEGSLYVSSDDTEFPWQATYEAFNGLEPIPTMAPTFA